MQKVVFFYMSYSWKINLKREEMCIINNFRMRNIIFMVLMLHSMYLSNSLYLTQCFEIVANFLII